MVYLDIKVLTYYGVPKVNAAVWCLFDIFYANVSVDLTVDLDSKLSFVLIQIQF